MGKTYWTGERVRSNYLGWKIFLDTSWDGRGTDVAVLIETGDEIVAFNHGSAESLSALSVRKDAAVMLSNVRELMESAVPVLDANGVELRDATGYKIFLIDPVYVREALEWRHKFATAI